MTKIRKAAQLVEDLKTLGIIKDTSQICCLPGLNELTISVDILKSDYLNYIFVKDAFEQEFLPAITTIEKPSSLQFILN